MSSQFYTHLFSLVWSANVAFVGPRSVPHLREPFVDRRVVYKFDRQLLRNVEPSNETQIRNGIAATNKISFVFRFVKVQLQHAKNSLHFVVVSLNWARKFVWAQKRKTIISSIEPK